jgi:hypothetical protein
VPEQRDVLAAEFDHGGHRFMVLANHWKSRFGSKKVSDGIRMTEAKAVRQELDRRLYANPRAAILMAGDFNNDCDGVEITEGAGCVPDLGKCLADPTGRLLFNLHGGLVPEARGTLFYKKAGTWNSFDSISVTKAMLDQPVGSADGWRVRPGSYEVLRFPFALDPDKRPLPFRRVVDSDGGAPAYHAGYSDHLPVRVVITLGP